MQHIKSSRLRLQRAKDTAIEGFGRTCDREGCINLISLCTRLGVAAPSMSTTPITINST